MITRWFVSFLLFFLVSIHLTCQSVEALPSNVPITIDVGSEYAIIASLKPSIAGSISQSPSISIVLDEFSKRKVPMSVAWDEDRRYFGSAALMFVPKKPTQAFTYYQRLLGKSFNSSDVHQFRSMFPYDLVPIHERDTVGFRHYAHHANSQSSGHSVNPVVYSAEEMMAMSLEYFVRLAEVDQRINQQGNSKTDPSISSAVLTTPSYFTQRERQALLDAADLAGLHVFQLINQNTAALMQFAIDRSNDEFVNPHTAMIVNLGATSFEATIANISARSKPSLSNPSKEGHIDVLSVAFDRHLGGQYFENRLTEYLADKFNAMMRKQATNPSIKSSIRDKLMVDDVRAHPRAFAKLRLASEKAKLVLSANKESLVQMSGLLHDLDFQTVIQRGGYLKLIEPMLARIPLLIDSALLEAGLTSDQINSVTILGGATYTPEVQKAITQSISQSIGKSLNADEAVATGAQFRSIQLSRAFKTRPWHLDDITLYGVQVELENQLIDQSSNETTDAPTTSEWKKDVSLFKRGSKLNRRKTVTLSHAEDFTALLSYDTNSTHLLPDGMPVDIIKYAVSGLSAARSNDKYARLFDSQKPRVTLVFLLDTSGVASLVKAEAVLEETIQVPVNKSININTINSDNTTEIDQSTDQTINPSVEYISKNVTHRIPLSFSIQSAPHIPRPMNHTEKVAARSRLQALRDYDTLKQSIDEARNDVESFIYKTRARVNDGIWDDVSTSEDRETLLSMLSEAEDWLYEQSDAELTPFVKKLADLKSVSDLIAFRHSELTDLPLAMNEFASVINGTGSIIDLLSERPWVPSEEVKNLTEMTTQAQEWFDSKLADRETSVNQSINPDSDNVLTSHSINRSLKPIQSLSTRLMKLRKPKVKPAPDQSTSQSTNRSTNQSTNQTDSSSSPSESNQQPTDQSTNPPHEDL